MINTSSRTKRRIGAVLTAVLVVGMGVGWVSSFENQVYAYVPPGLNFPSAPAYHSVLEDSAVQEIVTQQAEAGCVATGIITTFCPQTGIGKALKSIGEKLVAPQFKILMLQALMGISEFAINRVAYEAAIAVAEGGPGKGSLFHRQTASDAWKRFGWQVASEGMDQLGDITDGYLGIGFDLCSPGDLVNLSLAIGIKQRYQPEEPDCDILQLGKDWKKYINSTYQTITDPQKRDAAITAKFAESLNPGKNEISAALRINSAIDLKISQKKVTKFFEQTSDDGFLNLREYITGEITTPSDTIRQRYNQELVDSKQNNREFQQDAVLSDLSIIGGLFKTAATTFTNTFLATKFNQIYLGLFDIDPINTDLDSFDASNSSSASRTDAEEHFSGLLATSPIQTTSYDALSEFALCLEVGTIKRGLNGCVIDINFLSAVKRADGGAGLTVQEAIDEGLINGDWPLISSEDKVGNSDSSCFSYGFCYANLVKLRKARILPVGWELAALRSDVTNPVTLQEVIDGFNDCTDSGTVGSATADDDDSKYCHLIDPNWVLKYPDTQCRATANGELRLSSLSNGRQSYCADTPSCVGEDNDGVCTDGYGYCVQEKNVWRFRGDDCPAEFATCLAFENVETGASGDFLVNTVDYGVCDGDNAGCRWYRTNKYYSDAGTQEDTTDDSYEWLPEDAEYITADRDAVWRYQNSSGDSSDRESFGDYVSFADYDAASAAEVYSYEDRIYYNNEVVTCGSDEVGCTQIFEISDNMVLNVLQNPSFEDDEDGDGFPDGWINDSDSTSAQELDTTSDSVYGSNAFVTDSSIIRQFFSLAPNNFYTASLYARSDSASNASANVYLLAYDEDGDAVDLSGTSYDGDCSFNDGTTDYYQIEMDPADTDTLPTAEWTRFDCTFTTTEDVVRGQISLTSTDEFHLDAFQIELSEDANTFTTGYNEDPNPLYYKIAPDYLGCTGESTDPDDCGSYAQMCTAQDVGCSLYTPADGDPSVPAIISSLDECPSECVGYTTYKQEATDYDDEDFPLYFIADAATSCSELYVGCDAFTNLGSADEGGETVEYYTALRSCLTEDMADGTSDKTASIFFTWEGSDNAGYQLMTWYLLESNVTDSTLTFDDTEVDQENEPGLAPCIAWNVTDTDVVECADSDTNSETGNTYLEDLVKANDACDEHEDIFDNPDCREFFDTEGNIHYREYGDTITISDSCTAYRKDESSEDDCDASGGYWTDQGFCRYFGLEEESVECPEVQNGCRLYTGGAGRNATTVLSDTFEGGTYDNYEAYDLTVSAGLTVSNESVAAEGHSLRITASSGFAGFSTVQEYLNGSDDSAVFDDEDTEATCEDLASGRDTNDGGDACLVDIDGDGDGDEECAIYDGESSCGTLVDSLAEDKTFVLEFWAKGSADLGVAFVEEGGSGTVRDFVDSENEPSSSIDLEGIELSGSWQLYTLGPLDTTDFDDFDENALLVFVIDASDGDLEAFVDNITLKQVEENIAIIKDSWVVPSTCDETPAGTQADQYYLGCEAYTDQDQRDVNIYQFSDICSEEVVGCDAFYHTYNSDSVYQQVFNARCAYDTDGDLASVETVSSNSDCVVDETTYCTVKAGQSYCTFNSETVFEDPLPLDTTAGFGIIYGPETVVVSGDQPVYIVATDDDECTSAGMGCQEVGVPVYVQDQSEVESFETAYLINSPDSYENILCANNALFCEEWSSTQDGNWYFKDPIDKDCAYKTSVTIEGQSYFGWFRSDINEPCDFDDDDGDGSWDPDSEDAYLIAGEEFGVWRNGDDAYDGWVASCNSSYDLCTEFIDVVDTGGGLNEGGQSYYFLNDAQLSEDQLLGTQRCDGLVSQKQGCALLNNTTTSDLSYNANASYIVSNHADVFLDREPNDLVDPIDCDAEDAGVFEISSANALIADVEDTDGDGEYEVNLCARRCSYDVDNEDDSITTDAASQYDDTLWFERSCYVDIDCPNLTTALGEDVDGSCLNITDVTLSGDYGDNDYTLTNDSNEIMKVNRDRSCGAWLACESSRTSWNISTSTYQTICDSVNLCREGGSRGSISTCKEWDESDPVVLSDFLYSQRDVNWTGYEYSGYSIPNQLPPEHYNQFNINPTRACYDYVDGEFETNDGGNLVACDEASDCSDQASSSCADDDDCSASGACNKDTGDCYNVCTSDDVDKDYRLVYNAGSCDSSESDGVGTGGACKIGYCESSPDQVCSDDDECSDNSCIIGFCQVTGVGDDGGDVSCSTDDDCDGVTGNVSTTATTQCDPIQGVCVDDLSTDDDVTYCDGTCLGLEAECVTSATTAAGSCYNNRCLTDIIDADGDHLADDIDTNVARTNSCRGYPETDSPFTIDIVDQWQTPDGTGSPSRGTAESVTLDTNSIPYTYVSGYQDAITCAPNSDGELSDDCLCSYDKVEYGDGGDYRYYPIASVSGDLPLNGICSGGDNDGIACDDDDDCEGETSGGEIDSSGRCLLNTRVDSLYGWEGYCIERDTSIQLNGSSQTADQACLTWLPIDQTAGSTDLYGKYTEAGFPIENTYYCAESAYYADLYPMGVYINEVTGLIEAYDSSSNRPIVEWACALGEDRSGTSGCTDGEYCGCYEYAYCPTGWTALVGKVGTSYADSSGSGWCSLSGSGSKHHDAEKFPFTEYDSSGADSGYMDGSIKGCPYVCVPDNSYHISDNGVSASSSAFSGPAEDKGESCDNDYEDAKWNKGTADDGSPKTGETTFGNTYYLVGSFKDWDDSGDDISIQEKFADCTVRGVPINETDEYDLDWDDSVDGYSGWGYGFKIENDSIWNSAWGITHRSRGAAFGKCSENRLACNSIGSETECESDISSEIYQACADYVSGTGITTVSCGRYGIDGECEEREVGGSQTPINSGSLSLYIGCYEIVQATTSDLDDPNKAWTNRLLQSSYEIVDDNDDLAYGADTERTPGSRALFEEYYSDDTSTGTWVISEWGDLDSWPLPVASCDTDPGLTTDEDEVQVSGITGIVTQAYDVFSCQNDQRVYPNELQYEKRDEDTSFLIDDDEPYALAHSYDDIDEIDEYYQAITTTYGLNIGRSCLNEGCGDTAEDDQTSVVELLGQLFTKVYQKFRYSWDDDTVGRGSYQKLSSSYGFDESSGDGIDSEGSGADAFPNSSDRAPKIVSVGECVGSQCFEGDEDEISVNGVDEGNIVGEGQKHTELSFYAYAAPNQLPLKKIIADWGDAHTYNDVGEPDWPTDNQSGSTSDDNFYKNHRGMNAASEEECDEDDEWGKTSDSCASSYVTFGHDYTCTARIVNNLDDAGRECIVDSDGQLVNSPCTGNGSGSDQTISGAEGACVFQPRVFAVDNWGWCVGECDYNDEEDTSACYGENECEFDQCPGGDGCSDNDDSTINPWVYFDGFVVVDPS